jgi:hypothetical protein
VATSTRRNAGQSVCDPVRAEPGRWRNATQAQRALLELSDERAAWERRLIAAERAGFRRGYARGLDDGYRKSEDERDTAWRFLARPYADPVAYRRELAQQNLRTAEAGSKRDADEHERAFVGRAHATQQDKRTEAQRGTGQMYPGRAPGAAQ